MQIRLKKLQRRLAFLHIRFLKCKVEYPVLQTCVLKFYWLRAIMNLPEAKAADKNPEPALKEKWNE